jgi:hypothetical protein
MFFSRKMTKNANFFLKEKLFREKESIYRRRRRGWLVEWLKSEKIGGARTIETCTTLWHNKNFLVCQKTFPN